MRPSRLIRLRGEAVPKGCPFLFPGDVPGQPVIELKRFWARMREKAEIPDVRIHDLRHTFASLLVSGGASLEMIGKLLGHTQIGTTQRYAHLDRVAAARRRQRGGRDAAATVEGGRRVELWAARSALALN